MENEWKVDFVAKEKGNDTYPTIGYSTVTVENKNREVIKAL
ncbi:MAG: hypothetical protein PHX70_02925 [Clostridium sp.]|nr:hypothetical protein [Clostridium sp.]